MAQVMIMVLFSAVLRGGVLIPPVSRCCSWHGIRTCRARQSSPLSATIHLVSVSSPQTADSPGIGKARTEAVTRRANLAIFVVANKLRHATWRMALISV